MNDKKYKTKILLIYRECYPPTYSITEKVVEYDIREAEEAVKEYEEALTWPSEYNGVEIKIVRKEER